MSDKRRQARHEVSLSATLTIEGSASDCTVLNISVGGALLAATMKYSMGQRGVLAIQIPTVSEAIEVGVTVRWSNREGVGIQFDGLRARDVWALNEFFKQLPS